MAVKTEFKYMIMTVNHLNKVTKDRGRKVMFHTNVNIGSKHFNKQKHL